MARRRRQERVLLPWEKDTRRGFLKKGLLGGAILAVAGSGWLVTRRTRPAPLEGGPFQVLSPEEATVILAVADRFVLPRVGFPSPLDVGVPRKVDRILAMAHPEAQKEARQLIRVFENALAGLAFEGQFRTFTASSPDDQDARLASWARSRIALRRTGYRALKRLVYSAYYASPETHAAVGYRAPAPPPPRVEQKPPEEPPHLEPKKVRVRPVRPLAPKPLDVVPEPRGGIAIPEREP